MSFAIIADSTCDMTLDELNAIGVTMIPLTIDVAGGTYLDQYEISSEKFYELMASDEAMPKTSQPNPAAFQALFEQKAEEGCDGVLTIHIAPVLSGTLQSACIAADMVDVPVIALDSKGASGQFALVVQRAAQLRDEGLSLDETAKTLGEEIKSSRFFIACDTLDQLLKGGRLAPEEAEAANALNIKPILTFDEIGNLRNYNKARGMNGVRKLYVEELARITSESGKQRVRFLHSDNLKEAEKLREAVIEAGIDFEEGGLGMCGATVGTYLGAGAVGFGCIPTR